MPKLSRLLGKCVSPEELRRLQKTTPVEALRLAEDIYALRLAKRRIESIDPLNVMDTETQGERDTAEELVRNTLSALTNWQRYAEQKLRHEYLAM